MIRTSLIVSDPKPSLMAVESWDARLPFCPVNTGGKRLNNIQPFTVFVDPSMSDRQSE